MSDVRYWANQHGSGVVVQSPTLEVWQAAADATGMTLDAWFNDVIKKALGGDQ